MANIRLLIEYDGTEFHGWQRQPYFRTVQGELERAIPRIFNTTVDVHGAGRTDTGVHALGYVCNFHVETDLDPQRVRAALTHFLPDDIVVHDVAIARQDFHARFSATARRYAYRLTTAPTALYRHCELLVTYPLDIALMETAAQHFRGEHDFTSFTLVANDVDPVCDVTHTSIVTDGPRITFTIEANRFIRNMVRALTGTLIEVGRGRMTPDDMPGVIAAKDRRAAGPTAPPTGLTFVAARYPGE